MTKIAVTGGSGKAGRVVVRHLFKRGHQVLNIDQVGSPESNHPEDPIPFLRADLTDFGQALEALSGGDTLPGIEAVVHLAAIPSPGARARQRGVARERHQHPFGVRRRAAAGTEAHRVGVERDHAGAALRHPPDYAPVDEKHMRPETSYALSKVVGEEMARAFHRWSGIPIIGLRFSNVMVRSDYARFAGWQDDPHARKWNLWGYVDESHVAQSVERALEADIDGTDNFIIAAADTVMRTPSRDLMAEVYPACRWPTACRGTTRCWTSATRARCSATTRSSAGATSMTARWGRPSDRRPDRGPAPPAPSRLDRDRRLRAWRRGS